MRAPGIPLVLFAVLVSAAGASAQMQVDQKVVGPPWEQGVIYTLSSKGLHLATAGPKGSRFVVTVDGVEGQKFEEILNTAGRFLYSYSYDGSVSGLALSQPEQIAFSPDGTRYAYAARNDKDVILILDGKEIYRAPFSPVTALPFSTVHFTPDGKHLLFLVPTADGPQTSQLMVDAKPVGPPFSGVPYVFYSDDNAHWGLLANAANPENPRLLVIDGKPAGYTGEMPSFAPDGRLVCTSRDAQQAHLLVDGKPLISAFTIKNYTVSSTGDIGCVAMGADSKDFFYLNGKKAEDTEHALSAHVSPDGKHWAVRCFDAPSYWMIVDGKKQQNYNNIQNIQYSPDSSKLVYIAEAGQKKFIVVNGEEGAGCQIVSIQPSFKNNHLVYGVNTGFDQFTVFIDGKPLPQSTRLDAFSVSPDGTRVAYYAPSGILHQLFIDGAPVGSGVDIHGPLVFSPDSRHLAALAGDNGRAAIYRDGKFFALPKAFNQYTKVLSFTADGQHLLYQGQVYNDNRTALLDVYYIDDQPVATFASTGVTWHKKDFIPVLWEVQPDGSVVLLGAEPMPYSGSGLPPRGSMKRVTVTPGAAGGAVAAAPAPATAEAAPAAAASPPARTVAPLYSPPSPVVSAPSPVVPAPSPVVPAAPATPSAADIGVNPTDADIKGLKINQPIQQFVEAAKKAYPSVRFDPAVDPTTVFMSNDDKTVEAKGFIDTDGTVFAMRYARKLKGDDVAACFDSLIEKYGKPIVDTGPRRMNNGLIMRAIGWTRPNVLTPPAAGLFAEMATSPAQPPEGILIINLRMAGEHNQPPKPGQAPPPGAQQKAKPKLDF